MKGIDIFCASQAATSIHSAMDIASSSSSSSFSTAEHSGGCGGGRAIDRHNPIIIDPVRTQKPLSSLTPPVSPNPKTLQHNGRKGSARPPIDRKKKNKIDEHGSDGAAGVRKRWGCGNPGDFITPPGSSRYLLGENGFWDVLSDFDPGLDFVPPENITDSPANGDDQFPDSKPISKQPQVVVLRVSLHCKGCERKMRKHISRMEGVTSFNIDFAAKKLTVIGDVTPAAVLASVSKVKNAKLWAPPPPNPTASTPPSSSPSSQAQIMMKDYSAGVGVGA